MKKLDTTQPKQPKPPTQAGAKLTPQAAAKIRQKVKAVMGKC